MIKTVLAALGLMSAMPAAAQQLPEIVAIDVLVVPDVAAADAARAMNARLRTANPSGYALDARHAPHITLVQRYVHRGDLPKIQAAVAAVLRADDLAGLKLRAEKYTASDFGGGLLLLDAAKSPELQKLADDVVSAVQPFAVSGGTAAAFVPDPAAPIQPGSISWVETFVPKASGVNFAPHVTIGTAPFAFVKSVAEEPFVPFAFKADGLAIYQLGNYGTAAKRLWELRVDPKR